MKHGVFMAVLALVLVAVVGGGAAVAQDVAVVNLPFKFTVGNKILNPGKYEVRVNEDRTMIMVTPEKGAAVMVPSITRLGVQQPITDAKLIFDKIGEQYTLSEVWLPGGEDGFLVHDTKQPHKHHIVTAEKKKT